MAGAEELSLLKVVFQVEVLQTRDGKPVGVHSTTPLTIYAADWTGELPVERIIENMRNPDEAAAEG